MVKVSPLVTSVRVNVTSLSLISWKNVPGFTGSSVVTTIAVPDDALQRCLISMLVSKSHTIELFTVPLYTLNNNS